MSELRVDSVKSKGGGAPDLPKGVTISGIATAVTLGATTVDVSNVNVSGVVTSATLNGPLLSTGTPTLGLGVTINSSGLVISGVATAGIVSATTLYGDGTNVTGVGATLAPLFYNPDISDRTVTVGTGIGITFNSQIKAGSGNINLRLVSIGGTIVEAFGVGSSVTISENRLSFDPASDLDQNTIYCVDIPCTALTNNEGTAYVGTAYTFQSKYVFKTLWAWGTNNTGGLGLNDKAHRSSPIQIPGLNWEALSRNSKAQTFGALKSDGTMWVWGGYNPSGQLGLSDTTQRSSPTQLPGTTWGPSFQIGYTSSQAIKTDGTLWMWGFNNDGNLGHNNRTQYSSPKQVGSGTDWKQLAMNTYAGAAVKTDGTLWTWGANGWGQLGQNSRSYTSSPVQIPGTTWDEIAGVSNHYLARKTDNTLWAWGYNIYGNLAQNNKTHYSSPVQIPGTNWITVGSGAGRQSFALREQ